MSAMAQQVEEGGSRQRAGKWIFLALWAVLTLVPMVAYAIPLWQNALADTPIAYLVWIPILAVLWGVLALAGVSSYPDDAEIDALMGVGMMLAVGMMLVIGALHWPYTFVFQHAGLLLWPFWALGVAWMLFGIGVTRRLLGPLLYMLLVWPPLLSLLAAVTQGVLVHLAVSSLGWAATQVVWLRAVAPAGTFLVQRGGILVPILVSNACSGADSLLAAAILLPLLLTGFQGAVWRKGVLVIAALAGALVFNLVRLGCIIATLHYFGTRIALGVVHPILGFVLFAVLGVLLMAVAGILRLQGRSVREPFAALLTAGRVRLGTALLLAAAVAVTLWPAVAVPEGAPGRPMAVASADPVGFLPTLPGFQHWIVATFDDASILGPGSVSIAEMYRGTSGATVLVEVWSTPYLGALESYGYQHCLLFHGDVLRAMRSFDVGSDTVATNYAVDLPPRTVGSARTTYADVLWDTAAQTPSGMRYLRYSVAALPQAGPLWPANFLNAPAPPVPTGIRGLMAPPTSGRWPKTLLATQRGIESFARHMIASVPRQPIAPAPRHPKA